MRNPNLSTFAFTKPGVPIRQQFPTLKKLDFARLLLMATYQRYQDEVLRHENGKKLKPESLRNLLKLDAPEFNSFIDRITAAGIFRECADTGELLISKELFYRGHLFLRKKKRDTDEMFRCIPYMTIREMYADNPEGLAFIYSVLPFVHTTSNIIVRNPEEKTPENVQPITDYEEMAQALGYGSVDELASVSADLDCGGNRVISHLSIETEKGVVITDFLHVDSNAIFGTQYKDIEGIREIIEIAIN